MAPCRYSMIRMVLAPCSPFTVTKDLMVKAAQLARKYEGVRLHTHMAENQVTVTASPAPHRYCLSDICALLSCLHHFCSCQHL